MVRHRTLPVYVTEWYVIKPHLFMLLTTEWYITELYVTEWYVIKPHLFMLITTEWYIREPHLFRLHNGTLKKNTYVYYLPQNGTSQNSHLSMLLNVTEWYVIKPHLSMLLTTERYVTELPSFLRVCGVTPRSTVVIIRITARVRDLD